MERPLSCCIKINLPGGVVSAGDFYEILEIAENAGATALSIGNRQQLYFCIDEERLEDLQTDMLVAEIQYEVNEDNFPNIISSYVTDSIFNTESWLKEGVYKDIFDLFTFKPRLKVNLVDQHQTFVPFFSGNFNFISSPVSNYWYFYVRFPKTNNIYCWPSLIYSDDIPGISKTAEEVIFKNENLFYDQPEIDQLLFFELVSAGYNFVHQSITETLKLLDFTLPFYEGFNKHVNGRYWLGIYRRNETFLLDFLKDICAICLKTRVGQLYTTPWKSLLIKGINEADRRDWGNMLNKHQINVRHAANELNWQLEDLCSASLELKKQLVRVFEEHDIRTYRLCFAIKMQPKTGLLASVIIKRRQTDLYDILHTRDFNPNSKDVVVFRKRIRPNKLGKHLIDLCAIYYNSFADTNVQIQNSTIPDNKEALAENTTHLVYRCKYCLSIYSEQFGDPLNGVAAGTAFETLDAYSCPVCDSAKDDFEPVQQVAEGAI
jgi:rubredoxin